MTVRRQGSGFFAYVCVRLVAITPFANRLVQRQRGRQRLVVERQRKRRARSVDGRLRVTFDIRGLRYDMRAVGHILVAGETRVIASYRGIGALVSEAIRRGVGDALGVSLRFDFAGRAVAGHQNMVHGIIRGVSLPYCVQRDVAGIGTGISHEFGQVGRAHVER